MEPLQLKFKVLPALLTALKGGLIRAGLLAIVLGMAAKAQGKTVEPLYEDPFDMAAGGAVLTRSTQEAMLISNPALLPYGGKFFRWLGNKVSVRPGLDSIDLLKEQLQKKDTTTTAEDSSDTSAESTEFIEGLFKRPIHLGVANAISFITNNGGIAAFISADPDVRAWKRGDPIAGTGTPNVVVRNEIYGGAYGSVALRSPWPWLSFGLSAKYLMVNDGELRVDITDQEAVNNIQKNINSQDFKGLAPGFGADAGTLLFLQGQTVDLRLGATLVNAGGVRLKGRSKRLLQTTNVGLGLTLHTAADAIHMAADFRDVGNAHKEPLYKRVYLGTKVMLHTYVGIAAGIYHGNPSYGAELDLLFARVSATLYTREYGVNPGVDARRLAVISIATGWAF